AGHGLTREMGALGMVGVVLVTTLPNLSERNVGGALAEPRWVSRVRFSGRSTRRHDAQHVCGQ
ncbi:MAG: hypothetical protein MK538_05220, partial [Planctomycetes bacterium]|nr:hypothetical protein [Planctomycetota bacterium]